VREVDHLFSPILDAKQIDILLKQWHKAVDRSKQWVETND